MNLSLRNRVAISFVVANFVVLILSFTVFHFLNQLNKDIEVITSKSNKVSLLTDEIRISAVTILKKQREILTKEVTTERVNQINSLCESFISQLNTLESLYIDSEAKRVIAQMLSYVDSLKLILSKAAFYSRDNAGMASIGDLADKILDTFSELQDIQLYQSVRRDKKIKQVINETKRNMMITLIIGFLGTIILGLVIPGKIALPFKKIKDAIRELQDCNFDVSIYYNQDDEIGEIAKEMNRMIHSFKIFDELRTDRINVELRKFDMLANLVKKLVLVANADGRLIYMNNKLYSIMQVQSEDIIGKDIEETPIDKSIVDSYNLAIKRRSKIENAEISILAPRQRDVTIESNDIAINENGDEVEAKQHTEEVVFQGYANVIPIRGKDSSLDYYLMILSTEVFT